jgi:uncharacterized membrane protein YhhN
MTSSGRRLVLAAGAMAAVFYLARLDAGPPALLVALKPLPVLALAAWAWPGTPREARGVPRGLIVCAAGDVLLALDAFLAGVAVFLAAHLLYLSAFLGLFRRPRLLRALPFLAWGAGTFTLLAPVLGRNLWPVAAYMIAIVAMMWRAAALVGAETLPRRHAWWALSGAVLFGASDTLLALHRFYTPWPDAPLLVMSLYWAGQAALAQAVRPRSGISAGILYHHAGPPAA